MIKSGLQIITPEMAKKYLNDQAKNRKWRRDFVDRYKTEMLAGRWHVNGQPIIFDEKGRMVDGQHRMMAIVESKKPIEMLVVSGVRSGLESTIDMGKARTLGDVFQLKGVKNARLLSRTSKLILVWEKFFDALVIKRSFTKEIMNVHPSEIFDFYLKNQIAIDRACADFKRNIPIITNVGGPVLSFAFFVLEKIDMEKCYLFINSLIRGHIKKDWNYMTQVRDDFLARVPTAKIRLSEGERISILFGVWNVVFNRARIQDVTEEKLNIPRELLK